MRLPAIFSLLSLLIVAPLVAAQAREKYQSTIDKGNAWLAKQQHRDGHWGGRNDRDAILLTSLAGLVFIEEGSTPTNNGKYAGNLDKAVDWMLTRCQPDGRIGTPPKAGETADGLRDHAFALRFLARICGEVARPAKRQAIRNAITKAVNFAAQQQSPQGGWSHRKDRADLDVTTAMLYGLGETRNAGIPVPKAIWLKAKECVRNATMPNGGVAPRINAAGKPRGTSSAVCTSAALAGLYEGDFRDAHSIRWLKFCQRAVTAPTRADDPWLHYYYAQTRYRLDENVFARVFLNAAPAECLTWSSYRRQQFDRLQKTQKADGSWPGVDRRHGPIFTMALNLSIMQLDTGLFSLMPR